MDWLTVECGCLNPVHSRQDPSAVLYISITEPIQDGLEAWLPPTHRRTVTAWESQGATYSSLNFVHYYYFKK